MIKTVAVRRRTLPDSPLNWRELLQRSDVDLGRMSLWERVCEGLPHRSRMVAAGDRIARTGDAIDTVIFPTGAIFVLARQNAYEAQPLASGVVGTEGMLGWSRLLGDPEWQHDALAIVGGDVVEVRADILAEAADLQSPLRATILRYVHNYTLQLTQNTIANLGHSLERRLARWLVMVHDRSTTDELRLTHDTLAMLLNVRRASVTDALHLLEGERVLRCTRGLVTVRDRAALQAAAGYSYGYAENDYQAAIGPFGRASAQQDAQEQPTG